ncbi:MAG: YqjF family protein [Gemmatimonadaceae bacterium]
MSHPAFREVGHRPWPIPDDPWVWSQSWNQLAFLHWPVPQAQIRPLVPDDLIVEEFDGSAWVAVVPFAVTGATLRLVPPLPGLSTFPETNVRTYVRHGDRPGAWFFSLDADSHLSVLGGRWLFDLPYVYAEMRARRTGTRIDYVSRRSTGERFAASYEPTGPGQRALPGSLEHFLTERYCLYAQSRGGGLYRAEIHHLPWPLQPARASIEQNDLLAVNGLSVSGAPIVHYAERQDVAIWPLRALVR